MLFSELCKIIVNKVTFVDFRGGDCPNPLDPPLVEAEQAFSAAVLFATKIRSRLSDQSVNALSFLRSYYKKMNKKLAGIVAGLILFVLSLAHC